MKNGSYFLVFFLGVVTGVVLSRIWWVRRFLPQWKNNQEAILESIRNTRRAENARAVEAKRLANQEEIGGPVFVQLFDMWVQAGKPENLIPFFNLDDDGAYSVTIGEYGKVFATVTVDLRRPKNKVIFVFVNDRTTRLPARMSLGAVKVIGKRFFQVA